MAALESWIRNDSISKQRRSVAPALGRASSIAPAPPQSRAQAMLRLVLPGTSAAEAAAAEATATEALEAALLGLTSAVTQVDTRLVPSGAPAQVLRGHDAGLAHAHAALCALHARSRPASQTSQASDGAAEAHDADEPSDEDDDFSARLVSITAPGADAPEVRLLFEAAV
eukprot:5170140-Prymnesium_polylepis.1